PSHSVLRKKMSNQTTMTEFLLLGYSDVPELQILYFVVFLVLYLISLLWNLLIVTAIALGHHLHTAPVLLPDESVHPRPRLHLCHHLQIHGQLPHEHKINFLFWMCCPSLSRRLLRFSRFCYTDHHGVRSICHHLSTPALRDSYEQKSLCPNGSQCLDQ
ncbi:unnamed protein product, partial [Caretta caretta]